MYKEHRRLRQYFPIMRNLPHFVEDIPVRGTGSPLAFTSFQTVYFFAYNKLFLRKFKLLNNIIALK